MTSKLINATTSGSDIIFKFLRLGESPMRNRYLNGIFFAIIGILPTFTAYGLDKYILSSGDTIIKTAVNKKVNVQDTLYTTQAGNVGIGTTTPAVKLDVNGTLKATAINFQAGACATGYILVPADGVFTFRDFCVMKYHATLNGTTQKVESLAASTPWVSITQPAAIEKCKEVGTHLITNSEWMTIARNIETTAINDIDAAAGLQLATGPSDNAPANAIAATTDPSTAACTLTLPMSDAGNASCAFRTATVNTGPYYLTTDSFTSAGYSAGVAGKSQMRTHFLSNGNVVWDMAGNVWSWVDLTCTGGAGAGNGVWYNGGAWADWTNANLTDWEKLVAGPAGSLTSVNGAGQYSGCTANGSVLVRGCRWDNGSSAGVFAAGLGPAPSSSSADVGFRCAYAP
jgi:hypothetical protein